VDIFNKFFPQQEAKTAVGLDVGNYACKLLEVQRTANGFRVLNWVQEPVAGGDKATAIKKLLAKFPAITSAPLTAVAGKGTLIRFIEMPKMALPDLKKSFAIEADKYFPFPLEQIYTDCFILDPNTKGNKMLLLVAAVKKELVDQRMQLVSELGFQADYITLNSVAVINALQAVGGSVLVESSSEKKNSPAVVGVLDIGEIFCNLTILVNGSPRFVRDIFIGGRDFSRAISTSLGISLEETVAVKINPGDKSQTVIEACDTVIANIVTELRLSFDYYITESNLGVSKLLLTGGTSGLSGVTEAFAKNLDMKVATWNPLETVELAGPLSSDEVKKFGGQMGVALGLAVSVL